MSEIDQNMASVEVNPQEAAEPLKFVADHLPGSSVAPAHGIAAIALSIAVKYHDMGMIKDGVLYQQYKMEGRNIQTLGIAEVFETAIKIENHLLASSDRIAKIIVDALEVGVEDDPPEKTTDSDPPAGMER